MMNPKKNGLLMGVFCLLLLSVTPSFALLLTFSTNLPLTSTAFTAGFTLPAFNTNLGTLDNIAFSYSINASGSVDVTNSGSPTGWGGAIISTNYLYTPSSAGSPSVFTVAASMGGFVPGGTFTMSAGGSNNGSVPIDSLTYGNWDAPGGGSLNFTLQASSPTPTGAMGSISFNPLPPATMTENGTFTVVYNYTPIPEPSTAGLLAAITVFGFLHRRRSTKLDRSAASKEQT